MALLLGALGLFIYLRFERDLDNTINQGLRTRATELTGLLQQSPGPGLRRSARDLLVQQEESFAQLLTPSGRIFATTERLGDTPLLDRASLERAKSGSLLVESPKPPGVDDPVRLLARPVDAGGRSLIAVVGTSIDDRDEALSSLGTLLLIGGPAALILA